MDGSLTGVAAVIDKDLAVLRAEVKNSIIVWVVGPIFLAQLLPVAAGLVKHYFP